MTSKAVKAGELFFARVARSNMTAAEIVVYDLRIERSLVRQSRGYHRARLAPQSANSPGAALDQALGSVVSVMGRSPASLGQLSSADI